MSLCQAALRGSATQPLRSRALGAQSRSVGKPMDETLAAWHHPTSGSCGLQERLLAPPSRESPQLGSVPRPCSVLEIDDACRLRARHILKVLIVNLTGLSREELASC
eukprot:CAMPEP_0183481556 /NCGR_PEP_ID=MMETSP0370-20130417/175136_1 /TAXON_ID=268820 /ORGANISM="Peridinium aciculiferum, Strain PAER-2" /LENGTH=106 /DNA_ID=CAMNT_0025674687 /DNA_START=27 /DNA_END=344 /DNA_ORIENTATION=-